MLISTKGRYALRVMIDLAEHYSSTYIPLKEIAARQDISEKYLESILATLSKARLVLALRGKGGGYMLTKDPSLYTVGSILKATEGDLAPVSCLTKNAGVCDRTSECKTLPVWTRLLDIIDDYLESVTLADLVSNGTDGGDYVI